MRFMGGTAFGCLCLANSDAKCFVGRYSGVIIVNTVPLYLVVLLCRLLDEPDASGDPSMCYAEGLIAETLLVLGSFYDVHDDALSVPDVPSGWRASLSFWDTEVM